MDHYADAQMQQPAGTSLQYRSRTGLLDDSRHGDYTKQEVAVPSMSIEESQKYAQEWQKRTGNITQILWVEIAGPPEKGRKNPSLKTVLNRALHSLFPVLTWGPKTTLATFRADLIAGLTVGVMIIPQSMSYAAIAGLDYKYGMYSSLVPLIVYAFTGTSRQLAVGPVAMISLLVEVGLKDVLTETECPGYAERTSDVPTYDICPDEYAELAFMTSFLVGVIQFGAGLLRLGFLVSFLAHPVVSGFTSGAAIIIGLSQIQYIMGYKIPKSQFVYETLENLFKDIDKIDKVTFLMGMTWWFLLVVARQLAMKFPKRLGWLRPCGPLIVCVLAIMISANWDTFNGCTFAVCDGSKKNDLIVGGIPSGFPAFTGASLKWDKVGQVLPTALQASLIGFMESIAIAKSLAAKHQYTILPTQELLALGLSNGLGSLFSCYPTTGSFSRSAVNNMVGAKTNLAGFVTALLMLLTLLVLTDYFYFLPKYCLAAIVISSVTNLVDIKEAKYLWRVKRSDFCLWIGAFLGTLLLGIQLSIALSVAASLLVVIYESVRPQITVLWRLPGTEIYRNIKQDSVGHFVDGVLIVRVGASMYFANVAFIRDRLKDLVNDFYESGEENDAEEGGYTKSKVNYIVLECTAVITLDSAAVHMIEGLHREFKARGVRVAFATVGNRVEKVLRRAGALEAIGAHWFHPSVHAAVTHCVRHRMGQTGGDDVTESLVAANLELETRGAARSEKLAAAEEEAPAQLAAMQAETQQPPPEEATELSTIELEPAADKPDGGNWQHTD